MQKNLVKLSYLGQKVLQRGRVPVLYLVDLPSIPTQNNGRKMPIFVPQCILPSHTGFKNIFRQISIVAVFQKCSCKLSHKVNSRKNLQVDLSFDINFSQVLQKLKKMDNVKRYDLKMKFKKWKCRTKKRFISDLEL